MKTRKREWNLQAWDTIELGADGGEENDHRVVARLGHNILKGKRVKFDDAPVLGRLGLEAGDLLLEEGLVVVLGLGVSKQG